MSQKNNASARYRAALDAGSAGRRPVNLLDPQRYPTHLEQRVKRFVRQILRKHNSFKLLIVGARGMNAQTRVIPALRPFVKCGLLEVIGADCHPDTPNGRQADGITYVYIETDEDLRKLMAGSDAVLIETPPQEHVRLVLLAISVGMPLVICEKPAGDTVQRCKELVDRVRRAYPKTLVFYYDHYEGLDLIRRVKKLLMSEQDAPIPLEVRSCCVIIREKIGISPQQVVAQAQGAKEPAHHGVALMRRFLGLDGWEIGPCWSATCPESPILWPMWLALTFYRLEFPLCHSGARRIFGRGWRSW